MEKKAHGTLAKPITESATAEGTSLPKKIKENIL